MKYSTALSVELESVFAFAIYLLKKDSINSLTASFLNTNPAALDNSN